MPGNFTDPPTDYRDVNCEQAREALSARLDAEAEGVPGDRVDRHLAGCADCRGWSAEVERQHRRIRVRPAAPVPDLTARILTAADRAAIAPDLVTSRAFARRRWLLAGVAAAQFALLAVEQLGAEHLAEPAAAGHLLHEGAAWNAALGIGFAVAAGRPRLAAGLLPTLTAFVAVLCTFAVVDLAHGRADLLREGSHLLVVAGWVLLWLLARDLRPRRPVRAGSGAPASRVDLDDLVGGASDGRRAVPRDRRRRARPAGRRAA